MVLFFHFLWHPFWILWTRCVSFLRSTLWIAVLHTSVSKPRQKTDWFEPDLPKTTLLKSAACKMIFLSVFCFLQLRKISKESVWHFEVMVHKRGRKFTTDLKLQHQKMQCAPHWTDAVAVCKGTTHLRNRWKTGGPTRVGSRLKIVFTKFWPFTTHYKTETPPGHTGF